MYIHDRRWILLSRNLAVVLGVITPSLETYRRWDTWQSNPPAFFDDYILGGMLLFGAWRVTKNAEVGQKFLAAGWGFALGTVYFSFFGQLWQIGSVDLDPSGVSITTAVAVKGIGFILILIGFLTSLLKIPSSEK
jgi:hypothetical protein